MTILKLLRVSVHKEEKFMIYVIGDTHGEYFKITDVEKRVPIISGDSLIVCGDFGFIFTNSKLEQHILDDLAKKEYTILFVDGNHENFPALNKYPVEEWKGGKIHRIRPNIIHLMRGQIFNIDGKTFFTFGGAFSTDRGFRRLNVSYWDDEIPNNDEINEGRVNLEKVGNKVDYIITHTLPSSATRMLGYYIDDKMPDKLFTDFLDEVRTTVVYKKWFAGHFHKDQLANGSDNIRILYNSVAAID